MNHHKMDQSILSSENLRIHNTIKNLVATKVANRLVSTSSRNGAHLLSHTQHTP